MTYAQLTKGAEVTLEDKLINPIDWCKYFQGFFWGVFKDTWTRFQVYMLFILLSSLLQQFSLQINQHMSYQDQCSINAAQKPGGNTQKKKSAIWH